MHPAQTASVFTALVPRRQQLLNRNARVSLPQGADARYSFIDFFLSEIHLRYDPGDGAAVPCDYQRFAPLYVIEQLR
jgi:hypothetical protein